MKEFSVKNIPAFAWDRPEKLGAFFVEIPELVRLAVPVVG
jgi:hypothetical protein